MKIVLIAHANEPIAQPFPGGLESMCWHLAAGLRRHGLDVEIYAGPGSDPRLGIRELPIEHVGLSDIARRDVAMPPERVVSEHFAYLDLMMSLRNRADVDVIHNNSLHYLPLAMSAAAAAPMVTTLHTPPTPWLEPTARRLAGTRARFVAVSRNTQAVWGPIVPSETIYNGVDTQAWGLGPGGADLVWFGRIVPEKAPHRAIQIARTAGRRLTLAGPIRDRSYFEAAIAPQLDHDISYAGHLAVDQLSLLAGSSAACLVTPDWDEPFGLVAAEAMSTGTPVVVFDRGGLGELVADGGGIAVDGADLRACTEAVRAVERLDRVGVRAVATRRFSIERMITDYIAIYDQTAERLTA